MIMVKDLYIYIHTYIYICHMLVSILRRVFENVFLDSFFTSEILLKASHISRVHHSF